MNLEQIAVQLENLERFNEAEEVRHAAKRLAHYDSKHRAEVVPLDKIVHIDRGFSGVGGDADATPKVTVLFAAGDWFGRDAFARAIGYQRSDMNNGEGKK